MVICLAQVGAPRTSYCVTSTLHVGPEYMRIDITQSAADLMNKVDAARKALKNDIADMQQMIENTNSTIAVAKLTLAHLEMARDANCAQAS